MRVVDIDFSYLSHSEYEVLCLLARGATNAQIARHLKLSVGTVRNVVARLSRRLGVTDRTQTALLGYQAGLADEPWPVADVVESDCH